MKILRIWRLWFDWVINHKNHKHRNLQIAISTLFTFLLTDVKKWSQKSSQVDAYIFIKISYAHNLFIFFVKVLPSAGRTWTSFSGRYGWRAFSWRCLSHPHSPSPRATGSSWSRSSRRVEESPARELLLGKVSYAFVVERATIDFETNFLFGGLSHRKA